jgi:hypothetical protein
MLVVDDELARRELLTTRLMIAGYEAQRPMMATRT